jgi:hypothetical protein
VPSAAELSGPLIRLITSAAKPAPDPRTPNAGSPSEIVNR